LSHGLSVIASEAKQSAQDRSRLDCFVAAAKRQFILSDAAGGVEGLPATTGRVPARSQVDYLERRRERSDHHRAEA
jgi:hypothetical protein